LDPHKIEIVVNWAKPTKVLEVRSILELAEYYRRFVKNFSCIPEFPYQFNEENYKFE